MSEKKQQQPAINAASENYTNTEITYHKQTQVIDKSNTQYHKLSFYSEINNEGNISLLTNKRVEKIYRYGLPFMILVNIGLFIDANLNPGAIVGASVNIGDFTSKSIPMKKFTLVQSVVDMWKAGVYPLSVLIAVFSGFWPYIKLIMMMLCWTLKEKVLPVGIRDKLLTVLDAAGKWSLVDAFVLVMMTVGFRFNITQHLAVEEQANIIVNPEWGFYGFFMSAILSFALTHIMIHQHRKTLKVDGQDDIPDIEKKNLSPKNMVTKSTILSLMIISFSLLIVGSIIDSFAFTFEGAAGYILPADHKRTNYSLITIGYYLPLDMSNPNAFGPRLIQVVFFMLSFILPIIFLLLLIFLYLYPLKLRTQQKIFDITEIIYSWSCLDVMVISVIVALVEIKQFAAFIIGDSCDGINQMLKLINDNNMKINIDPPVCFSVVTTLDIGCVILFLAAFLFFCLGSFTLRNFRSVIEKRLTQINCQYEYDEENSIFGSQQEKVKQKLLEKKIRTSKSNSKDI